MLIHRRSFLQGAGVLATSFAVPTTRNFAAQDPTSSPWRTFEVTTRVEVLQPAGVTRLWIPVALRRDTPFQRTLATTFHGPGGSVRSFQNKTEALELIAAEFPAGVAPVLAVTSRVRTRNWAVNWAAPNRAPQASASELQDCLQSTRLLPTDGIVKQRATEITQKARTDLDKARAIYEWIVENTYRNPKTRGCGVGNIRFLLESGDLGGKCADLNALYVGLARAAGLPARDVYGLRVAASQRGYQSLGASSENVTKAQHCRAEVYLSGYGWVPVDPADVRKVMLEEPPGHRPLEDDKVQQARTRLFGSWEMNWMAYNYAQDVRLPGSSGPPVPFLMYPQAETAKGRLDSLDPEHFRYQITAQEVTPAKR
ncbi:MAG: transglutaminase domain-containing protein [Acidobacteriaceae bacterium]|nr:transglutaminase domain-containing protein [Acidobacteriaceae bacterium]